MFSEPVLKQVAKSQEHAAIASVWLDKGVLMDTKWVVGLVLIQKLTRRALFRLMIHIGGINRPLAHGESKTRRGNVYNAKPDIHTRARRL
jgi:hypothetical protein